MDVFVWASCCGELWAFSFERTIRGSRFWGKILTPMIPLAVCTAAIKAFDTAINPVTSVFYGVKMVQMSYYQ